MTHPFRRRWKLAGAVLTVGALVLAFPFSSIPVSAQELTYTTTTRAEFGGALGTMMSMVSDADTPSTETVFLKGSLMRTDDGEMSTIVNLGGGEFTVVNHQDQTWYSFSLQDMQAQMASAMKEGQGVQGAEPEAQEGTPETAQAEFDLTFSVDRTGRSRDFDGYTAQQVLATVTVVPKATEDQPDAEEAGSMVLLTELWLSNDLPGYEAIKKAQAEAAGDLAGQANEGLAPVMEQAFASDPRMKEAFQENAEQLAELDGIAVRSVTSFVAVPPGQELNREAVLAASDQPLGPGAGDVIAGAAEEGAKEAARGAVRSLTRGLLGGRREEPKEEEAAPTQTILMRLTSAMEDVSAAPIPDSTFQPPAGYREVKPDWMKGGGGVR